MYHTTFFLFRRFLKFSNHIDVGHFENIELALKYQFKTFFYKYKHLHLESFK